MPRIVGARKTQASQRWLALPEPPAPSLLLPLLPFPSLPEPAVVRAAVEPSKVAACRGRSRGGMVVLMTASSGPVQGRAAWTRVPA